MGTDALVVVLGGPVDLDRQAAARIAELERRWTRFDPESELSRLNTTSQGRPTVVSAETYRLVSRAAEAWRRTGGRFDPSVLDAVVANGYDRTFASIPPDRVAEGAVAHAAPGCGEVLLDDALAAVTLPIGVRLDPGGIGKGLAADIVAEELMLAGADGVLVDLGGDIRVAGEGPDDGQWVVDVAHPLHEGQALLHIATRDAGIATSSRLRRRWNIDGAPRHHLLDPATGEPTTSAIVSATVITAEAWWSEALTKVLVVTGDLGAISGASAVMVDEAGVCTATTDLAELLA